MLISIIFKIQMNIYLVFNSITNCGVIFYILGLLIYIELSKVSDKSTLVHIPALSTS